MSEGSVLATFFGDEEFPVDWEAGQQDLFWVHDDLHIPNPVSPMYADIGGWWLKCDYMFRRFGTPFASDWIVKIINGYVYTAAIPATVGLHAEATEYGARYTPRVPLDTAYPAQIGAYLGWTLPYYAANFLDWWRTRLRPEMEHNFVRFDDFDYDGASLLDLAILLEDAIDMHDRHWSIHWVLNFAQFSSTMALNGAIAAAKGEGGDHSALMGRLQSSTENRNWDSIAELWKIKEWVKAEGGTVAKEFERPTAGDVLRGLETSEEGRAFVADKILPYQKAFGYKSMWAHEFSFTTWRENPAPIVEAIRGYLEVDYDFPSELKAVGDDLEAAKAEVMQDVADGPEKDALVSALELSLKMNPLTPDHHFYIDQGTNARVRLVLVAIGRKLVASGALSDPEDVMYLKYNELRALMAGVLPEAQDLVSDRRDDREAAFELRPRDWVGTATAEHVAFPYLSLWAFPEKLNRKAPESADQVLGLPASVGVVEGTARVVVSPEQFDAVQKDEIVVCRMTSPAWVVLFTKISGLVTDAGGMASHPAVVSREFGIPAVVGTSDATRRIKTGDRVRVNGALGRVDILTDGVSAPAGTPQL